MTKRIVMTATAKMPLSVKSPYIRIAVVELEDGFEGRPRMISLRARGVSRIVRQWTVPAAGKTERSGKVQAFREAERLCKEGRMILLYKLKGTTAKVETFDDIDQVIEWITYVFPDKDWSRATLDDIVEYGSRFFAETWRFDEMIV